MSKERFVRLWWKRSKIENMLPSRGKKVHTAEIGYKSNLDGKRVVKTVERPVFPMVKLMEVKETRLLDIKVVQEAVDVENYAHRIENDDGVAAEDNLNWFFGAHYNEVEAEENNVPTFSNAASEPENICLNRDAELLKYRHLKVIIHPMS